MNELIVWACGSRLLKKRARCVEGSCDACGEGLRPKAQAVRALSIACSPPEDRGVEHCSCELMVFDKIQKYYEKVEDLGEVVQKLRDYPILPTPPITSYLRLESGRHGPNSPFRKYDP
jgi:hypothetical protein